MGTNKMEFRHTPSRLHTNETVGRHLERIMYTGRGAGVRMMEVMTTDCIACGQPITQSALAIGAPYHGLIHNACAAYYHWDGSYPHPLPVAVYRELALNPNGTTTQLAHAHQLQQQ